MILQRNERGQTTVFMALFIATMVMLFAFTTNIGMFVHAKINLQNAADAAAYSGAAVQARQLTTVGYLNFEIRRAMKEFLFRYMVRGNSAQTCFPSQPDGSSGIAGCPGRPGTERYTFNFFDPREGIREPFDPFLPSVCIVFDQNNNYCQKSEVSGLAQVTPGGFGVADPLVASIFARTEELIARKIEDCEKRTEGNIKFLAAWLFHINPTLEDIVVNGGDTDSPTEIKGIPGFGVLSKIGLIRARIASMEDTLNMSLNSEGFANGTVDDGILANISGQSPAKRDYFERSIQAYLSARNNLVTEDFNGIFSDVKMTELLPATGDAPSSFAQNPAILTKFDDINGPFTVSYSQFLSKVDVGGNRGGCQQLRRLVEIPGFPYGVHKNPSIVTYYAVKLSAKAKLLFNPFGRGAPVTLTAYSAAKPFGSRIGKNIGNQPTTMMYATGLEAPGAFSVALSSNNFPNLLVGIDHVSSQSDGFAQREHLGYLRAIELNDITNRSGAFRVAGAYAPWELGYYTPPANFAQPVDMGIFDNNPVFDSNGYFPLRAPIMNPKSTDNSISFVRNIVESYLSASSLGGAGASSPFFAVMQSDYLTDDNFANLFAYMQTNGFDMNHPVLDPLLQDNPTLLAFIRGMGGERFTVAASPQGQLFQMSSWNSQKTASDVLPQSELGLGIGRSGYSVRFVSFQQLAEGGQGSTDPDSSGSFNNPFTRLGGTAGGLLNDISKIRH